MTFICRDLWTGVKEFETILETKFIENEGEIEIESDEIKKALVVQIDLIEPLKVNVASDRTLLLVVSTSFIKEVARTFSSIITEDDFDISFYQEVAT